MDRAQLALEQDAISLAHANNTLIIQVSLNVEPQRKTKISNSSLVEINFHPMELG